MGCQPGHHVFALAGSVYCECRGFARGEVQADGSLRSDLSDVARAQAADFLRKERERSLDRDRSDRHREARVERVTMRRIANVSTAPWTEIDETLQRLDAIRKRERRVALLSLPVALPIPITEIEEWPRPAVHLHSDEIDRRARHWSFHYPHERPLSNRRYEGMG